MNKNVWFLIFVSVLSGLNVGSIRRAEDPIRDTQTNPILYEQKKKEEKDGKKGPLMYHVRNNPRESFFIDPPFEKEKKTSAKELTMEHSPASVDATGWWEEQPATSSAVPAAEAIPEPFPEAEQAQNPEAAGQSASAQEAEKTPSGKADDYWW